MQDDWNEQLSRIEIKCDDRDEKVKFYTALYHSMIAPTIYSDVDGAYYGPDKQVHRVEAGQITVLSPCGTLTVRLILSILLLSRNG